MDKNHNSFSDDFKELIWAKNKKINKNTHHVKTKTSSRNLESTN